MTGLRSVVKAMSAGATMPAARSGSARVAFFGMSSPSTMEKALTKTSAVTAATPAATDCATQPVMTSSSSVASASCIV